MKIITNNQPEQKKLDAIEAWEFLSNHPAVNPGIFSNSVCDGLSYGMLAVCKNGFTDSVAEHGVQVYMDDPIWGEKYRTELEKEWAKYDITSDEEKQFTSVDIPYRELFGEPWKFDHVCFWWEMTFFVYEGDPYNLMETLDYKKWNRHAGGMSHRGEHPKSFEEMIIEIAEHVKKEFGSFDLWEDFYTPQEIVNHELEVPWFSGEKTTQNTIPIIFNDKRVDVTHGLINLRWLKWYLENRNENKIINDWGPDTIAKWHKLILNSEVNMPKERKELLEKYE